MGTPPKVKPLKALLLGEPVPEDAVERGGTPNKDAVRGASLYAMTGDPGHLDASLYFGRKGPVGHELITPEYGHHFVGSLLAAAWVGQERGHVEVAEATLTRAAELLSCWSLFTDQQGRVIPVCARAGKGWSFMTRPVARAPVSALVRTAETGGNPNNPSDWWRRDYAFASWILREMSRRGLMVPRLPSELRARLVVARRAGILQPLQYRIHRNGWSAFAPKGVQTHDQPIVAVASGAGRTEILSPSLARKRPLETREVWSPRDWRVTEIGGTIEASCWVVLREGTPQREPNVQWKGRIDIGWLGPVIDEIRLDSPRRRGWDFGGGEAPPPPPPPPEEDEEEPMTETWKVLPADISVKDIEEHPRSALLMVRAAYALLDQEKAGADLDLTRLRRAARRHQGRLSREGS